MEISTYNKSNISLVNGEPTNAFSSDMDTITFYLGKISMTLCAFGLLANGLSIAAICNIQGNMSAHSKLIISLAALDILVLLTSLLIEVIDENLCWIQAVKIFLMATSLCATLANLLLMAVDHYVAVVYPMTYNIIMSKRRCVSLIFCLWALSVVFGSSDMLTSLVNNNFKDVFCNSLRDDYQMWHVLIAIFFIVLLIIIGAYLRIYCIVRHMNHVSAMRHHNNVHSSKTFFTTVLIVTTFAIGWLPHELSTIYQFIIIDKYGTMIDEREMIRILTAHRVTLILVLLNSCADPLIYGLRLQSVRAGYMILFKKISRR